MCRMNEFDRRRPAASSGVSSPFGRNIANFAPLQAAHFLLQAKRGPFFGAPKKWAEYRSVGNDARTAAFWSIDAAFALVLSVAMFAMLSSILYAAGMSASRGADETSGVLLSARFSSYALERMERGGDVDLQAVLAGTGKRYASLRTAGVEGEISFAFAGEGGGNAYCTARLYAREGRMVRMEACIG